MSIWNGLGTDNKWSTAANWDVLPVPGDDLIFDGGPQLNSYNDFPGGTVFNSITFNAGSGNFFVRGNSIVLSGGASAITCNATPGAVTISNNFSFLAAPTVSSAVGASLVLNGIVDNSGFLVTVASEGTITLSGSLIGAGGLTETGSGALVLLNVGSTVTDTYDLGPLNNGTFIMEGAGGLIPWIPKGSLPVGSILRSAHVDAVLYQDAGASWVNDLCAYFDANPATPASPGELEIGSDYQPVGTIAAQVDWGSQFDYGPGTSLAPMVMAKTEADWVPVVLDLNGVLASVGQGYFRAYWSGTLSITYDNLSQISYAGATTISSGFLKPSSADVLPAGTDLIVESGGALDLMGFQQHVASADLQLNSSLIVDLPNAHLFVTGTATLAGILVVSSVTNPAPGTVYTVITAATVVGTFEGLPDGAKVVGGGRTFTVNYTGTTVTLTDVTSSASRVFTVAQGIDEGTNVWVTRLGTLLRSFGTCGIQSVDVTRQNSLSVILFSATVTITIPGPLHADAIMFQGIPGQSAQAQANVFLAAFAGRFHVIAVRDISDVQRRGLEEDLVLLVYSQTPVSNCAQGQCRIVLAEAIADIPPGTSGYARLVSTTGPLDPSTDILVTNRSSLTWPAGGRGHAAPLLGSCDWVGFPSCCNVVPRTTTTTTTGSTTSTSPPQT